MSNPRSFTTAAVVAPALTGEMPSPATLIGSLRGRRLERERSRADERFRADIQDAR